MISSRLDRYDIHLRLQAVDGDLRDLKDSSGFSWRVSSHVNMDSPYELTQLIRAIAEPSSAHGVDRDVLTELLGLEQDPRDLVRMKQYAKRRVESEFLQPVRDLEDEYIGHWQMWVIPLPGLGIPQLLKRF